MSAVEIGRELNLNPSSVDAGMLKAAQLEQRVPMFAESVAAICARAKLKGAA
jgi:hypothetical protein